MPLFLAVIRHHATRETLDERLTVINTPQPDMSARSDPIIQPAFNVACDNHTMISAMEYR